MYNAGSEKTRRVHIKPRAGWGGPGLLGADISFGLGHRLPMREIDSIRSAGKSALKGILGKLTKEIDEGNVE